MMMPLSKSSAALGPFDRDRHCHIDETSVIHDLIKAEQGVMIDVGAHHGSSLIKFLEDGWSVYAFEPDDKNRQLLYKRVSRHPNKDHVFIDPRCVGREPQSGMAFYTSEESSGISSLAAFHQTHIASQHVDVTTLDNLLAEKKLKKVDFLKIDTEGYDLFVLQGFPWSSMVRPKVIECEFEDAKTISLGYSFHDLATFLSDRSYKVWVSEWHPVIRYGIRHDWKALYRYPCELESDTAWGNLLAFDSIVYDEDIVAIVKAQLRRNRLDQKLARALKNPGKLFSSIAERAKSLFTS
jgi:FkbM family methyltransferase